MRSLLPVALVLATALVAQDPEVDFPEDRSPEHHSRVLLEGPEDRWAAAANGLMTRRGPQVERVLAEVARRLPPEERIAVASWFGGKRDHHRPQPVIDVLFDLALDRDPRVRKAARRALGGSRYVYALQRMIDLVEPDRPDRPQSIDALEYLHRRLRRRVADERHRWADPDGFEFQDVEERAVEQLASQLQDDDPEVRAATIRALGEIDRENGLDRIAPLLRDADPTVSAQARATLAAHQDVRSFWPSWERAHAVVDPEKKDAMLRRIGRDLGERILITVLERIRADDDEERRDLASVLAGMRYVTDPELLEILVAEPVSVHPDIRRQIERMIARSQERQERKGDGEHEGFFGDLLLAIASLFAFGIGFVLFLWAFRLWKMRRVVHDLPTSTVRGIAQGAVAIAGRARAHGGLQDHPLTGESCVYHERSPDSRFFVEDDTGRVLVDAEGAVLLSEDGTITPNERVHVVATARSDASGRPVLGRTAAARSTWDRMWGLFLRLVFCPGNGGAATRMLFQDPRDFCWVWDDARGKPLQSTRETAMLLGTFALAGCWIVMCVTVFVSVVA